jgi:hypothetical protein
MGLNLAPIISLFIYSASSLVVVSIFDVDVTISQASSSLVCIRNRAMRFLGFQPKKNWTGTNFDPFLII